MGHSNDDFTAEAIDEQIERLLQLPASQQQTPSATLTQALKATFEEDAASIERVRQRYVARLQAVTPSKSQFPANRSMSFLPREIPTVRDVDVEETTQPVFSQPSAQRKRRWTQYVGMFAAVLSVALLLAGFFTLMNMAHSKQAPDNSQVGFGGTHISHPTNTPMPSVFTQVVLTASSTNGEGVGPGLTGIPSQDHFTVGQKFMILYTWSAHESGPVVVKWYANGQVYQSSSDDMCYVAPYQGTGPAPTATPKPPSASGCAETPAPGSPSSVPVSGAFSIIYAQPTTGKVELYWKGQLAVTLPFVVSAK